jgi:hypothetical protein
MEATLHEACNLMRLGLDVNQRSMAEDHGEIRVRRM